MKKGLLKAIRVIYKIFKISLLWFVFGVIVYLIKDVGLTLGLSETALAVGDIGPDLGKLLFFTMIVDIFCVLSFYYSFKTLLSMTGHRSLG